MHNAGRTEDGEATHDAQPGVPGLFGQRFTARNRNFDLGVGKAGLMCHGLHHLPGHGIDGGFAHGNRQSGLRHRSDAGAGLEAQAFPSRPHGCHHEAAMCHIRVVSGILDDSGLGVTLPNTFQRKGKTWCFAARKR